MPTSGPELHGVQEGATIVKANIAAPLPKALYRVTEAKVILSLSRSAVYEEIRSGRLRSVTRGRTRLIPASAIAEYVELLEREAGGEVV